MAPRFFASGAAFRRWLHGHHASADELLVGFYKKDTGRGGITYPEALDEALCYGWIDGVRRRHDEESYAIRFTPRRKGSIWSAVNTRRVKELTADGRMAAPRVRAFEARQATRDAAYSYVSVKELPARRRAPEAIPGEREGLGVLPGAAAYYRRMACWYVMSAKRPVHAPAPGWAS